MKLYNILLMWDGTSAPAKSNNGCIIPNRVLKILVIGACIKVKLMHRINSNLETNTRSYNNVSFANESL